MDSRKDVAIRIFNLYLLVVVKKLKQPNVQH